MDRGRSASRTRRLGGAILKNGKKAEVTAAKLRAYTLDRGAAAAALAAAPAEGAAGAAVVPLPAPNGELQRFALLRRRP